MCYNGDIIVNVGKIISEPFLRFKARIAISRAIVPLETVEQNFLLTILEICFQILLNSPFEESQLVFIHIFKFLVLYFQLLVLIH